MKRFSRLFTAIVAGLVVSAITIPTASAAPAQGGDGDTVVIAAGHRGNEYNISSGSQLSTARSMLLDDSLFGPSGTVVVPEVEITEDTTTITSDYLDGVHVLFDGWDRSSGWSSSELDVVEKWVNNGGVLITTNDDPSWDALGTLFGAETVARTSGNYSAASRSHPVVDGPFGSWSTIRTAGWISHLGSPRGFTVIANDASGNAAVAEIAVGDGHVIVLADEGPIRMASGGGDNRTFTGNLFAHAISLSDAPDVKAEPAPTPTAEPTVAPTPEPTAEPTTEPTTAPTAEPTATPGTDPAGATPGPTAEPTAEPTTEPTAEPTAEPTTEPTSTPEPEPTAEPTATATPEPTTPPADEPSLELVSDSMASMVAGDDGWIALTWRALADVEDLQVTLSNDAGVVVTYPENTNDHAGPALDTGIPKGASDYTAFHLEVPSTASDGVALTANVTWTAFGERQSAAIPIKLPTIEFTGQDLEVVTTEAAPEDGWITVHYRGLAPQLSNLELRVTDTAGADVEYPRGDFTSLTADAMLEAGETDLARFFVGDSVVPASVLTLTTTYDKDGEAQRVETKLVILDSSSGG